MAETITVSGASPLLDPTSTTTGILASTNYDVRTGLRQARQVLLTGGSTIRSISLNVEPIGSLNLPTTHEVDIRLAQKVSLGTAARFIELRADIYNVLNKGTIVPDSGDAGVTGFVLQSGPSFQRPLYNLYPRILQVGAAFAF